MDIKNEKYETERDESFFCVASCPVAFSGFDNDFDDTGWILTAEFCCLELVQFCEFIPFICLSFGASWI
jgi:hypothetical protein